jgi:hypothetical protein
MTISPYRRGFITPSIGPAERSHACASGPKLDHESNFRIETARARRVNRFDPKLMWTSWMENAEFANTAGPLEHDEPDRFLSVIEVVW